MVKQFRLIINSHRNPHTVIKLSTLHELNTYLLCSRMISRLRSKTFQVFTFYSSVNHNQNDQQDQPIRRKWIEIYQSCITVLSIIVRIAGSLYYHCIECPATQCDQLLIFLSGCALLYLQLLYSFFCIKSTIKVFVIVCYCCSLTNAPLR